MKRGAARFIMWLIIVVAVFFAAFFLSVKLYIEPSYDYISKNGIDRQIAEMKETIAADEQRIAELEDELDRYVNTYGRLEGNE
ncbi:MAG: hypothetical protein IJG50_02470 [Clostridia bacterium]|nr:hypothetical protein [Clostridia bacterium]